MPIQLSAEIEQLVQSRVDSGQYASADEVVREAFDLLTSKERAQLEWLHAKVDRALAQCDAGESVDGEEFCSQLLNDLDRRIALECADTR